MKVLRQDWDDPEKGFITSLSKDQEQLDQTYKRIKKKNPDVELDGSSSEITIPDDSPYAKMIERGTVFLHPDEMDVVYNSPENQ